MEQLSDFQLFIKLNKLKQKQVADYLGTSTQYVNQVVNGKCSLSDDKYELLAKSDWDVSMIKFPPYIQVKPSIITVYDTTQAQTPKNGVQISSIPVKVIEEIKAEVAEEIREEVAEEIREEVRAEIAEEMEPKFAPLEIARKPNLDTMEWLKKGNGRHISSTFNMMAILQDTHFYTEVRSNAMSPALTQGEVLFLQPFEDGYQFIDGHPYAVETKSRGLVVFYLYDRGDYVECRPHNVDFGTLKIQKADIIRYYKILFHGSTWIETSLPRGGCQHQVLQQSKQISTLIGELGKAGNRVDKMGEQLSRVLDMMENKLQ